MKTRDPLVLVVVGILIFVGIRALLALPPDMTVRSGDESAHAERTGRIIGAYGSVFVCIGLALAIWKKEGQWGLGVGIFAIVAILVQIGFWALAVTHDKIPFPIPALLRLLVLNTIPFTVLAISCFILYAKRRRANV